jgi:alkanesulfonate monooxygenase SsuD/methylene tetrahydromethanopterin reductase-like flavin-dependent oxidoreductase (luciferase family)
MADKPLDEVIEAMQAQGHALVGMPEHIMKQIEVYADAGVEEIMVQWFEMDNIKGLRNFAESVLHRM